MDITTTIWWTVAVLLVMWMGAVAANFGPVAHVLLALAGVLAVTNLVTRTRT
jgi:hypothetical protein